MKHRPRYKISAPSWECHFAVAHKPTATFTTIQVIMTGLRPLYLVGLVVAASIMFCTGVDAARRRRSNKAGSVMGRACEMQDKALARHLSSVENLELLYLMSNNRKNKRHSLLTIGRRIDTGVEVFRAKCLPDSGLSYSVPAGGRPPLTTNPAGLVVDLDWVEEQVFIDGGGCFHGSVLVALCDGTTKAIQDLVIGDRVISHARLGDPSDSAANETCVDIVNWGHIERGVYAPLAYITCHFLLFPTQTSCRFAKRLFDSTVVP